MKAKEVQIIASRIHPIANEVPTPIWAVSFPIKRENICPKNTDPRTGPNSLAVAPFFKASKGKIGPCIFLFRLRKYQNTNIYQNSEKSSPTDNKGQQANKEKYVDICINQDFQSLPKNCQNWHFLQHVNVRNTIIFKESNYVNQNNVQIIKLHMSDWF